MSNSGGQSRNILKAVSATLVIAIAFGVGFGLFVLQDHKVNVPSHAAATCTPNAILVYPCRAIVGAAAKGNPGIPGQTKPGSDLVSQFTYLEGLLGLKLELFRTYHSPIGSAGNSNSTYPFDPNQVEGKAELKFVNRPNTYVDLNWNVSNSWKDASGGNATVNQQIDKTAAYIKSVAPHKVFLSPWHEANLHVGAKDNANQNCAHLTSASNSNGTPSQFIAAWKNVRARFKADGATNVIWIWGLGSYPPDNCWVDYMWPGSSQVDWVNYDTYGRTNRLTWDDSAGVFYNYLKTHANATNNWDTKPWGIGEFGDGDAPTQQDGYNYFNNLTADIKSNKYPKLKMYMIYADTGNNTPLGTLTDYDTNPTPNGTYDPKKQQIINTMFATMVGGSTGQPTPTVSITAPAAGASVKGTVSVSASASVSSGSITKVVLSVAGKTVKSCTSSPCTDSWNSKNVANGSVAIAATATASDGKSASTSEGVTVNNPPPPPSVPVNITSPSQTTSSISLSWSPSTDANYSASQIVYHVFRNGVKVGTTAAGVTALTDKGLAPGTYYSYTVNAADPAGRTSVQSAAFTQNTKTPNCAKPKAPTGFAASDVQSTSVSLKWDAVSDLSSTCKTTGYVISRDSSPIAQTTLVKYNDTGVVANTKYTYSALAMETGNIAGPSSSIVVMTSVSRQPDPGPSAPTHVKGTAVSTTQINLSWSASSDPVTGIKDYGILRNGKQVGTSTTTSFGDSGLSANTVYKYQVVAVSGGNKTATSDSVSVKTLNNPSHGGHGGSGGSGGQPPILKGTHSVGSGSDTGQNSSQNPTQGSTGDEDGNGSTGASPNPSPQNITKKADRFKTVAYVGGGLLLLLAIIGALLLRRRKNQTYDWGNGDLDLQTHPGDLIQPGQVPPAGPTISGQPPQSGSYPQNPDGSEDQNTDPFSKGQ